MNNKCNCLRRKPYSFFLRWYVFPFKRLGPQWSWSQFPSSWLSPGSCGLTFHHLSWPGHISSARSNGWYGIESFRLPGGLFALRSFPHRLLLLHIFVLSPNFMPASHAPRDLRNLIKNFSVQMSDLEMSSVINNPLHNMEIAKMVNLSCDIFA